MSAIAEHVVVGNKRTAALVARDGTVDWFCPQRFDAPSAFASLLDPERGGAFTLRPDEEYDGEQRYLPDTNVAETTFTTNNGTVRVTDVVALPLGRALDYNQLIRRIEGVSGEVTIRWRVAPRFGYGTQAGRTARRSGTPVIEGPGLTLAVEAHEAGDVVLGKSDISGAVTLARGDVAVIALASFDTGPIACCGLEELSRRVDATADHWAHWIEAIPDVGRWTQPCRRAALTLDLMVDAHTGGIVAAPTLGLPERPGGSRNYDYRYVWLRDTNLTLEAMLRMGLTDQVHASLRWMFEATERSHPRLRPVFAVDRARVPDERELALEGYDHSRPVRVGNRARDQLQLDCYGHVFDMVWKYVAAGNALTEEAAHRLVELADYVTRVWERPDSGLWELPDMDNYTQSKLACALALQRAGTLAEHGAIPGDDAERWHDTETRIRAYVRDRCWDPRQNAYTAAAGSSDLDAAVLLAARGGQLTDERERLGATIDAIRDQLGAGGPLLYRTTGLRGHEGAFLACSFWMVEALARLGRLDEAERDLDALAELANPAGLYAEELDPATGALRGNFPQALTHLALVNAADVCARARDGRPLDPDTGDLVHDA